ncbi:hypothetical protein POTOM_003374 [Populus tomentosa]|uniref:Uncharacterized protein n=1 Tax=Populus tomentosa TaxID=118781 RepID=A0A8X8DL90_POPTO|nr:hypothetical protein POTOM_003374 [Populus tomentosa]
MWFRGGLGGAGGSNIGSVVKNQIVRHFSRARAVDVKRINPKVPFSEAASIAQSLYQVIKEHGPLTVSNTWNQAKCSLDWFVDILDGFSVKWFKRCKLGCIAFVSFLGRYGLWRLDGFEF